MASTLTYEQIKKRKRGLGGSDMNALCGLSSRWRPIDVFKDKIAPPREEDVTQATVDQKRGVFLEPAVRNWYADEVNGWIEDTGTIVHPDHPGDEKRPAILCTPDGLVHFGDGRPDRGVEVKAPRFTMVADWCNGEWPADIDVPPYYHPQLCMEAACLGVSQVDMAVLLGDELRILPVPYDRKMFEDLVYIGEKFWRDHVVTGIPPTPDGSQSYADFMRSRHPRNLGKQLVDVATFGPDRAQRAREFARCFAVASESIKQAEKLRRTARAELELLIGDEAGIDFGDGNKVTWTNNRDGSTLDLDRLFADRGIGDDVLAQYRTTKPGPRCFRANLKGMAVA